MKTALLYEHEGLRTFAVVLATGEEVMQALAGFAAEHHVKATQFTAIGAFSRVIVAYFDWSTKEYRHIPIAEQVEVLSLVGDRKSTRLNSSHGYISYAVLCLN